MVEVGRWVDEVDMVFLALTWQRRKDMLLSCQIYLIIVFRQHHLTHLQEIVSCAESGV